MALENEKMLYSRTSRIQRRDNLYRFSHSSVGKGVGKGIGTCWVARRPGRKGVCRGGSLSAGIAPNTNQIERVEGGKWSNVPMEKFFCLLV